jgi:transcriptional regulator with XRE-family HTH domain
MAGMADKDPFAVEFAARLRAAMTVAGLSSAAELARVLQHGESRVRNWCNGTATPTVQEAARLAKFLRVTMDWLFRDSSTGLEEGRHIRLMAAMEGVPQPDPALASALEEEARPEVLAPLRQRRRAKVASD